MSTPVKSTPTKTAPAVDSPGTWRHPRLNEITRRREASTFSEKNVLKIAYNIGTLLAMWIIQMVAGAYIDPKLVTPSFLQYLTWAWSIFQILPVVQIIIACLPLMRAKDDLSDIPLTAAQRQLLGLPPSANVPKSDVKYSTPPRYSRTPSMAGSVGSRGSYTHSPLSGRGSPALGKSFGINGSPYSPMDSPQQQQRASFGESRRSSFSSTSNFGASTFGASTSGANLFGDPASPSPATGKRTTVGLNSKWLYEKGRRSSGSAWVH